MQRFGVSSKQDATLRGQRPGLPTEGRVWPGYLRVLAFPALSKALESVDLRVRLRATNCAWTVLEVVGSTHSDRQEAASCSPTLSCPSQSLRTRLSRQMVEFVSTGEAPLPYNSQYIGHKAKELFEQCMFNNTFTLRIPSTFACCGNCNRSSVTWRMLQPAACMPASRSAATPHCRLVSRKEIPPRIWACAVADESTCPPETGICGT
jgi:hypothetical protein